MQINENLRQNDLQYLISPIVSVDEYTSKIDSDNITIAFFVKEIDAAEELIDFLNKFYFVELRDTELSDSVTDDNNYIVFAEFERNDSFPKIFLDVIDTVNYVADNKDWKIKVIGNKEPMELSLDNIRQNVRLTKLRDTSEKPLDNDEETVENAVQEALKPFVINDNGWIRKYVPKGYITEKQMEKMINESQSFNNRDEIELQLLENAFPESTVITLDNDVLLINNDGILQIG